MADSPNRALPTFSVLVVIYLGDFHRRLLETVETVDNCARQTSYQSIVKFGVRFKIGPKRTEQSRYGPGAVSDSLVQRWHELQLANDAAQATIYHYPAPCLPLVVGVVRLAPNGLKKAA